MKMILMIAIAFSMTANAQVKKVQLQASGLTCSMCSNAINKALKTLDYVSNVDADIKTYTFEISFKASSVVDFDMIKKKVENAGFSVSSFVATVYFSNAPVTNGQSVTIEEKTFIFSNLKEQSLTGTRQIRILDKGFVPGKQSNTNALTVLPKHMYHASL